MRCSRCPGEITAALSAGSNALLRLGATPLTRYEDVLESFGIALPPPTAPQLEPRARRVLERVRESRRGRRRARPRNLAGRSRARRRAHGARARRARVGRGRARACHRVAPCVQGIASRGARFVLARGARRAAAPGDARRQARCRDRRRRHHRLLLCARARSQPVCACGSTRRGRSPAAPAVGTAASRCAAARWPTTARASGSGATSPREYWKLTEVYVGRMGELGGDAFRRTGSLRLAGDDERDELRAEYEALREDGFEAEWRDELPRAAGGPLPRRALPSRRRRAPARAAGAPARRGRGGGGRGDPRAPPGRRPRLARGGDGRRRHRRLPERPARRARGPDHPDAGSDDRDRAAPRAPLPATALRTPWLRLLAPERGRAA